MAAASRASVDIGELQDAASERIAEAEAWEIEADAARGVLVLDPQVLLPEHDVLLIEALRAALS